MSGMADFLLWPDRLEAHIAKLRHFNRVEVVAETGSTQDVARRESAGIGSVVVAGRQTTGRGQLGRSWADDEGCGVALTLVVASEQAETLCARGAVAVASALVPLMEEHAVCAGIKWPNDLVAVLGVPRKLAGILVEAADGMALVGIGVNVSAREWPEEIQGTAASLADAGVAISRVEVIEELLSAWDHVLDLSNEDLRTEFARYDVLSGARAQFEVDGELHEGVVRSVDPFGGVVLQTSTGEIRLNRTRAQLLAWEPRDLLSG